MQIALTFVNMKNSVVFLSFFVCVLGNVAIGFMQLKNLTQTTRTCAEIVTLAVLSLCQENIGTYHCLKLSLEQVQKFIISVIAVR